MWNHICCLDALALSSYGAESCLPATSDTRPPKNADDSDWHASRFTKPSSVPADVNAFKEMTFVIVRREIADLTVQLSRVEPQDRLAREKLLNETRASLDEKYLHNLNRVDSWQTAVAALIEISLSGLTLAHRHRQAGHANTPIHGTESYE